MLLGALVALDEQQQQQQPQPSAQPLDFGDFGCLGTEAAAPSAANRDSSTLSLMNELSAAKVQLAESLAAQDESRRAYKRLEDQLVETKLRLANLVEEEDDKDFIFQEQMGTLVRQNQALTEQLMALQRRTPASPRSWFNKATT